LPKPRACRDEKILSSRRRQVRVFQTVLNSPLFGKPDGHPCQRLNIPDGYRCPSNLPFGKPDGRPCPRSNNLICAERRLRRAEKTSLAYLTPRLTPWLNLLPDLRLDFGPNPWPDLETAPCLAPGTAPCPDFGRSLLRNPAMALCPARGFCFYVRGYLTSAARLTRLPRVFWRNPARTYILRVSWH
jgi:hypothetical protein